MKIIINFVLFISCILCGVYASPVTKIVGGSDAPIGAYPHQVSLRRNGTNSHFCGGSIISKSCILTAAHCVENETPRSMTVSAGTNFLNETGQRRSVKSIYFHKDFDLFFLSNDVAVVILTEDLQFSKTIQPIKISSKNITQENLPAMLSGWGRLQVGGVLPNALQHIKLNVIGRKECKAEQWRISESHICTLNKAGEGACHGDSGSPLIADGEQIGIVSFGTPCAKGKPDVFTRVSTFINWIEEHCAMV